MITKPFPRGVRMDSRAHTHHAAVDITDSEILLALRHPHRHIDVYGIKVNDAIYLHYNFFWCCSSGTDGYHIRLFPKLSYNKGSHITVKHLQFPLFVDRHPQPPANRRLLAPYPRISLLS